MYLSLIILAAGPAGIALAFWLIIIGRGTAPYWRPFLLNEPLGQRKTGPAPTAGPPLPPLTPGDLKRLHVGAAIFAFAAAGAMALFVLSSEAFLLPGCTATRMSCFGDLLVYQFGPLALLASIPVALLYLRHLLRHGVEGGEHLALGAWAAPRLAFVAATALTMDADGDAGRAATLAAVLAAVALLGASMASRRFAARTPLTASLAGLASVMTVGTLAAAMFADPLLLMIDGFLSAIAIGYGIYRLRVRFSGSGQGVGRGNETGAGTPNASEVPASNRYRVAIVCIIAIAVLASIILTSGPLADAAHPWMLVAIAGAAGGAVYLAGARSRRSRHGVGAIPALRADYSHAVVAFVSVAAIGATLQFADRGGFDDVANGDVYSWVLPAAFGSSVLLASVLFGRWHALRPFLLATVWPLMVGYCALGTEPGAWEVSASRVAAAIVLSLATLWAIWYAFTSPKIRAEMAAAQTEAQPSLRPATSQV